LIDWIQENFGVVLDIVEREEGHMTRRELDFGIAFTIRKTTIDAAVGC
jgi:hypothetical protein